MLFRANIQQLQKLAKNFYEITKTLITIYDDQQNVICAYPGTMCGFCREVRKNTIMAQCCRKCDQTDYEVCKIKGKTYIYRCHMGLLEVATPIVCNNVIIGYLLFGQIAPDKDRGELIARVTRLAKSYDLDLAVLKEEIPKVKYRTNDYIAAISELLEMCANHIWLNSIISVHNEGLAYSLDYYIRQNLREDLSVAALCSHFGISRGTLYNLSRGNFGCGITDYVTNCRISAAKKLLARQDLRIGEIAETVGYADVNYFIRAFKKHTGMTPRSYRTNL